MKRRKVLLGMGSLAAGSAAAMGTGAFTAMTAGRDANIDVVKDNNGLVGLQPGSSADGRVYQSDDGELKIDFTSDQGGQGVNVDSRYQVGVFESKGWANPDGAIEVGTMDPAFTIGNQDDQDHTVDIGYECNADDIGNATIFFQFYHEGDQNISNKHYTIGGRSGNRKITGTSTSAYLSWEDQEVPKNDGDSFAPGNELQVALLVDTTDVTMDPSNLDLSGTLHISID